MEKLKWILLSVLVCCHISEGLKILMISPMPGMSHAILGDAVVKYLLEAGHEITYITAYIKKNPHKNLRLIDVSSNSELIEGDILNIEKIMNKEMDLNSAVAMQYIMAITSKKTLENENVLNLLKDRRESFDVIIAEWMFNDMYSAIAAVYQCPLIWFSTVEPHSMVLSIIDEPLHPAYSPSYEDSIQPPFTFAQRVYVLYKQLERWMLNKFFNYYYNEEVYRKIIVPILEQRGLPVPTLEELKFNASLMLGNSHVSMGGAPKLPQNYINIGGFHIEKTVKPLPEDLKKIMDNAKNGVIYFSMGSNLKSKDLPKEMKIGLLNLFKDLKQTVIWKFEEVLPDMPQNVHVVQWAPQHSILAHPNCVLFITHGGLLSITEAIHYAVPVIAIPIFADQFINAERAVHKGFGVKLELSYNIDEQLRGAISKILGNPKYAEKAKQLSFVYHDRPVSPGAELVHWVEHVVRTRGAPHLRSPALHVPLYQKLYLDLLALTIAAVLIIRTAVTRLLCSKKNKNLNSKKKLL